jgi:outer membrane protein assembly factor BamB
MPCTHLTLLFACLLLMLAPLTGAQTAAADDAPEWHQHAHDAQNTSYAPQAVPTPWRWKWAWNGPDSRGEVSEGKTSLPRNVQPVTGAGRVYVAAGERGVYALDNADGAELWQQGEIGVINSTAAYDPDTGSVFALSTGGVLYRLDAASGDILAQFASGAASDLPLPPALTADHALFAMGDGVYALDKASLQPEWVYRAQADFHTPPAYSAARDLVIAVTEDLFVHAIDNASGDQVWHVRPTVRSGGPPEEAPNQAEAAYGWPAIADAEGLALVRYRLDWATLWTWDPWPG